MIALDMSWDHQLNKTFCAMCCLDLNARRAELVDSGEADPNISRRERLSSEPILCLKSETEQDSNYFISQSVFDTAKNPPALVLRPGKSLDFPWNDKSRHDKDLLTWTSHNRSGNRRQRWDVVDLEMGSYPPYARNPAQRDYQIWIPNFEIIFVIMCCQWMVLPHLAGVWEALDVDRPRKRLLDQHHLSWTGVK